MLKDGSLHSTGSTLAGPRYPGLKLAMAQPNVQNTARQLSKACN